MGRTHKSLAQRAMRQLEGARRDLDDIGLGPASEVIAAENRLADYMVRRGWL